MKKWIAALAALALALSIACAAPAEERAEVLYASIQHVTDSPAWVAGHRHTAA